MRKKRKKTQSLEKNFLVGFSQIDDFFSEKERSENSLLIFDDEIDIRDTSSQTQFEITSFVESQVRIHEFSSNFSSETLLSETTSQISFVVEFNFSASKISSDSSFFSFDDESNASVDVLVARVVVVAASISTISTTLSARERLNQIFHSIANVIERVRKKSRQQLKLKSQQRADVTKRRETKKTRETTNARKKARKMTSRKKNVSQLIEQFELLFSSSFSNV